ncbi:major facilitator superfamily domain-containing protein 12 [Fopius arisanus]|uniref:Major facilitator superfamily domain-containing protein 12 n=1 Tax=Fopius arisanus TaxID=64838 RepID=A0A0C9QWP9_9HYME|nr:PREDICTED: major facilitator superfamily domain-containing protein 12-like [Fopius arisanus]
MDTRVNSVENDYTEIIQRLPRTQKLAYGVGHILNDICASMWFTYLIVFFHYVLGFDPVFSGLVLFIGQIADALATPFVGLQSDKNDDFWLCRYGRRKTWHLLGTVCVLFSFPFIFSKCINCEYAEHWAQLIYYSAFIIIFQFGWASVQISHLSLIPDLTPTEHERTELTAIRYMFSVFANIFVYVVFWAVLNITSEDPATQQIGPNDASKFQHIVLIGIFIGSITSIIFHTFVREIQRSPTGPLRRDLRPASSFLKDYKFYQVASVYMSCRLFVNIAQIYVPLYLHESLSMPATSLAVIPFIMFMSSLKWSLIIEKINTKLGRKWAYLIGAIQGVAACIWIYFGHGDFYSHYAIYPVALLLGGGGSVMLVTSLGVTADLIGSNTESGAFVYGAMSLTDKLCNGIAVMIIQYTKRCVNGCPSYYRDVLSFVCGAAAIFSVLMIFTIKRSSENSEIEVTPGYTTLIADPTFEAAVETVPYHVTSPNPGVNDTSRQ